MNKVINQKLIATLCCAAICILIFYACKKTGPQDNEKKPAGVSGKFFEVKPGTDAVVVSIAASIKRQDDKRHFVTGLIGKAGFAIWDKAKVIERNPGEGQQIFIPFAIENKKQTRAILIVKLKGADTLYHLLYNTHAKHYGFDSTGVTTKWNAKDIFHAFILFDHEIFGHTKFIVKDGRFVNDTTGAAHKIEIVESHAAARVSSVYPVVTWVTFITCGLCAFKEQSMEVERCCNATYNTIPVTYWFNDEDDDWGYTLPDGIVENGAGGLCPGCNWSDTNPCDVEPPYTQFCDVDWTPEIPDPIFNPLNYDTIHVNKSLNNGFPCVAAFLRDSISNPNFLAQIAGADVFKDSAYMNLSFDTSTVYKTDTSIYTAYTEPGSIFVDGNGITTFTATIHLNPWFLRYGTKEFMVANILHEIMHATFHLRWGQYLDWLIHHDTQYDSNYIKNKFPMYWYAIQNQTSPLSAEQDHEIMAADYLGQFTNVMQQFYNPNASTATRDTVIKAMGYHGLLHTTAWKALPGQGMDTCKYKGMNIAAEKASTNLAPTGCASSYHYNYSTDLKLRNACQ